MLVLSSVTLACGGGTTVASYVTGQWDCEVEDSPAIANADDNYIRTFHLDVMATGNGGTVDLDIVDGSEPSGLHFEYVWELAGDKLSVHPAGGTQGYEYDGVSLDTNEIDYSPIIFDGESGEVAVERTGNGVRLSWDQGEGPGGDGNTDIQVVCRKED